METNRDRDESIASFIRDAIAQRQQAFSQLLKEVEAEKAKLDKYTHSINEGKWYKLDFLSFSDIEYLYDNAYEDRNLYLP